MNRPTDQRIPTVFLPGFRIQSENFNGLADPAIAAVCGFHRFFGSGFWILLVIKFGSWISVIVRNVCLCGCVRYCNFFCHEQVSPNVTQ